MNFGNPQALCYLDQIRVNQGIHKCQRTFDRICKRNPPKAVEHLNHPGMTYPTLYSLLDPIKSASLYMYLNQQNTTALLITNQLLNAQKLNNRIDYLSTPKQQVQGTLKWMLSSGMSDEPDDDYRQVIDIVVSVLIETYQDKTILPTVVTLMFHRAKINQNIHTLSWALFQSRDPEALRLIAEYLRSNNRAEAELACHLLHLNPPVGDGDVSLLREQQYHHYMTWLQNNQENLCFTGQSFQQCSNPMVCHAPPPQNDPPQISKLSCKTPVTPACPTETEGTT